VVGEVGFAVLAAVDAVAVQVGVVDEAHFCERGWLFAGSELERARTNRDPFWFAWSVW